MKIETRLVISDADDICIRNIVLGVISHYESDMTKEQIEDLNIVSIDCKIQQVLNEHRRQLHVAYKLGVKQGKLEAKGAM